jgi:hypothetical protein
MVDASKEENEAENRRAIELGKRLIAELRELREWHDRKMRAVELIHLGLAQAARGDHTTALAILDEARRIEIELGDEQSMESARSIERAIENIRRQKAEVQGE